MKKTFYKAERLNTCFTEPVPVWFRTEEDALEAVEISDTTDYIGPVEFTDPEEIKRIEAEITEREKNVNAFRIVPEQ